MYIFTHYYK